MPAELQVTDSCLKKLPLRAIVAYAAQCARRVQPLCALLPIEDEGHKHLHAIEAAIRLAEELARGEPITNETVLAATFATRAAQRAAQNARTSDSDLASAASHSALVAAAAARAAATAAEAAKTVDPTKADEVIRAALEADEIAGRASNEAIVLSSVVVSESFVGADDYEKLLHLGLGQFPELGEFVDASEKGPLGRYWLENFTPAWYAEGRERMKELFAE